MIRRINDLKLLEEINQHNILYIKVFYKKYKRYILKKLSDKANHEDVVLTIIMETILSIDNQKVNILESIDKNINWINEKRINIKSLECIENLQKIILSKWINKSKVDFAHVFYSSPLNMFYDGFHITFQSITIDGETIKITQYSRNFEVFYFSDYPMPYINTLNNIKIIAGKKNIIITFNDEFRFLAIPSNEEDYKKIIELKKLLSDNCK